MLNKNNFYLFIFIFFCVNIISFFIYFFFIKHDLYIIDFDKIKNVKSAVYNFDLNNFDKGILYYDNLDELHNNKLIKILKDRNICFTKNNSALKKSYYQFIKSSFPYISMETSMFNESNDLNSFIHDPIDKIYRITFVINDYHINFGLFSIKKIYNKIYLEQVLKKMKQKISEYNLNHHNNFHKFKNYVDVLNLHYDVMKLEIKNQISIKYKSNNPNLHPYVVNLPQNLNTCEKAILKHLYYSLDGAFIAKSRVILYEDFFNNFKNSIKNINLKVINKKQIDILTLNKKILFFCINFLLSLLLLFIYRKL